MLLLRAPWIRLGEGSLIALGFRAGEGESLADGERDGRAGGRGCFGVRAWSASARRGAGSKLNSGPH